jgi:ATP-dependent Clp protease ATP-binding subunit ClpA
MIVALHKLFNLQVFNANMLNFPEIKRSIMAATAIQSGWSQTAFSTHDTSRVLLLAGVGILTYEVVSKAVNKSASETLSKMRTLPLAAAMISVITLSTRKLPHLHVHFAFLGVLYVAVSIWARNPTNASSLPDYMVDMVAEAKGGAYIPKIGYEDALKKVEKLMNKKTKSNALLLGNPGVGKSTIPETIACKIATTQYPLASPFFGARLIRVDFTDLIAGTIYRGMLEQRVQEMIQLAKKHPKIIYFLDEIDTLVGGGKTIDSRVDVSKMLLPVMARGEIRIIGASTFQDYTDYIQPKQGFARRLPQVMIHEPALVQCFQMLQHSYGLSLRQSCIKVSNAAIASAIVLSKDVPNRYFPDKAIDLIDDAISNAELKGDDSENNQTLTEQHIVEALSLNSQLHSVDALIERFNQFMDQNPGYFAEFNDQDG